MSWLFCCGGSEAQKNQEKHGTFDLSKPIMAPVDISNQDGFSELSGNLNADSQMLNAILKAKSEQNKNEENGGKSRSGQESGSGAASE
jgi:hypothetical protein